MAKITEKRFAKAGKRRGKLETRSMRSAQGKRIKASRISAQSDSFGQDLLQSFARAVERERRKNRESDGGCGED